MQSKGFFIVKLCFLHVKNKYMNRLYHSFITGQSLSDIIKLKLSFNMQTEVT
jgi:hypothetical protein